ncbi:UNVERIFIED_CONTAM: hypothetical protein FKN15_026224 [Acipenser sinensis]
MEVKYNLKSPAVKRLMKEAAELRDPTEHYHAQPLEDNLFEWHFTVRGPPDSDFDGGVYHGRVVLPPDYPMKPPSIILLTLIVKPGMAQTTMQWESYFNPGSQDFCCAACGGSMRSALLPVTSNSNPSDNDMEAKELARQISFKAESSSSSKAAQEQVPVSPVSSEPSREQASESGTQAETPESSEAADSQTSPQSSPREEAPQPGPLNRPLSPRQRRTQQQGQQPRTPASPTYPQLQRQPEGSSHVGLAVLIVVLTLALAALIFRRIYLASEYKFDYEL